jgi:hypothetical protein
MPYDRIQFVWALIDLIGEIIVFSQLFNTTFSERFKYFGSCMHEAKLVFVVKICKICKTWGY